MLEVPTTDKAPTTGRTKTWDMDEANWTTERTLTNVRHTTTRRSRHCGCIRAMHRWRHNNIDDDDDTRTDVTAGIRQTAHNRTLYVYIERRAMTTGDVQTSDRCTDQYRTPQYNYKVTEGGSHGKGGVASRRKQCISEVGSYSGKRIINRRKDHIPERGTLFTISSNSARVPNRKCWKYYNDHTIYN